MQVNCFCSFAHQTDRPKQSVLDRVDEDIEEDDDYDMVSTYLDTRKQVGGRMAGDATVGMPLPEGEAAEDAVNFAGNPVMILVHRTLVDMVSSLRIDVMTSSYFIV